MRARAIIGVVLCLVGALWIFQGVGVAKGSFMTGHAGYAILGGGAVLVGIGLVVTARRARSGARDNDR